jgi:hypothetical protein
MRCAREAVKERAGACRCSLQPARDIMSINLDQKSERSKESTTAGILWGGSFYRARCSFEKVFGKGSPFRARNHEDGVYWKLSKRDMRKRK